uniref:SFRICE_029230 n=1 Tax=Spodoptera frugiperda TaxID=7108 RepID=A0A2H1WNC0_SPOFR
MSKVERGSRGGLEPHKIDGSYRSVLKLAIRRVTSSDYGTYKCVSKNSLGDTEGTIKLYPMPLPPMENKNVVQRLNIVADKSSESTPFGTQGIYTPEGSLRNGII